MDGNRQPAEPERMGVHLSGYGKLERSDGDDPDQERKQRKPKHRGYSVQRDSNIFAPEKQYILDEKQSEPNRAHHGFVCDGDLDKRVVYADGQRCRNKQNIQASCDRIRRKG